MALNISGALDILKLLEKIAVGVDLSSQAGLDSVANDVLHLLGDFKVSVGPAVSTDLSAAIAEGLEVYKFLKQHDETWQQLASDTLERALAVFSGGKVPPMGVTLPPRPNPE